MRAGCSSPPPATATSPGKHSPNRLRRYLRLHSNALEQRRRGDFVLSDDVSVERAPHGLLIEGTINCRGGIHIRVEKDVRVFERRGETLAVREGYSYNVALSGRGNIFRYDGPHGGHRDFHHVHRYDVLGDGSEEIIPLEEEETPTLGAVIDEAEEWYFDHLAELRET